MNPIQAGCCFKEDTNGSVLLNLEKLRSPAEKRGIMVK
jgi:hypothetical protein